MKTALVAHFAHINLLNVFISLESVGGFNFEVHGVWMKKGIRGMVCFAKQPSPSSTGHNECPITTLLQMNVRP